MGLGWGIIGIGTIANNAIAPAIQALPDGHLAAIVSRDRERADAFAEKHGAKRAYTDYGEMLADKDVDIVYIATPNALHAEQAIAAARAGKHVLCDKPLALTAKDAQGVVDACKEAGVKLGTNFQTRHQAASVEAKRLIDAGTIGDVVLAQVEVGIGAIPLRGWRTDPDLAGRGAVYNIGVHAYDLLRFLLSSEVSEVSAMADVGRSGALEVLALTLFRFQNGALAYVNANQTIPNHQPDLSIYGTKGRIVGARCTRPFLDGELRVLTEAGEQITPFTSKDAFKRAITAFHEAVQHDREPSASGSDGVRNVQITEAIERSMRDGVHVRLDS